MALPDQCLHRLVWHRDSGAAFGNCPAAQLGLTPTPAGLDCARKLRRGTGALDRPDAQSPDEGMAITALKGDVRP
ncbi:hypothetical protein [Synechococcus sp. CC9616]|uniref:hypothetical protein n=1 Tax=Synechococcus sp. CC9616 TaxID=110663 RepID=UPI0012EB5AE5|nr:hypothetical protein [Synechococcus sp. CC9616]